MPFGLDSTGFNRKRLSDILIDLDAAIKAIFGENLNLDPSSPDGQVNGVIAESLANLWEIAQESYNAYNPSNSVGVSLSNLVQLNGITRKAAASSTGTVSVTGVNTTIIPAGSLVSTDDNIQFATDTQITIALGVGSSGVTAVETGPITAAIGTITNIDTPITGWSTVTNAAVVEGGLNEETDADLRARRLLSIEGSAVSILESILAAVLEITDVVAAIITENITSITDADGLDPHSFQVMVDGGTDADIAEVIFNKKPIGVAMNGTTTVGVIDTQGISHDIKFQRPADIDIYVKVTLVPGSSYLSDADVKQAIVDFASGTLEVPGTDGDVYEGFGLGADVVYSQMYIPVNLPSLGIEEVTEILIDIVAPPTGVITIDIEFDEKASFDIADITIVQV